jgi:hypothetical protein
VCESLIIVQYIDDVWRDKARSFATFWSSWKSSVHVLGWFYW